MNQRKEWRKYFSVNSVNEAGKEPEEMHHLRQGTIYRALWIILPLLFILLLLWQVGEGYTINEKIWLPVHIVLETFSIVISFMIFGIGWHSYHKDQSGNILLFAIGFLAVGFLDLAHMLSFPGMSDFVTSNGPEKSIYFWLAARFLGGVALIVAALLPWKPFASKYTRYLFLVGTLILLAFLYWVGLLHLEFIPGTYVPGKGLTLFKISAEFLVIASYAFASILLLIRLRKRQPYDVKNLLIGALVMIIGEVWFTRYVEVNDTFIFLGHVYKVIAYSFLYQAVFVENVRDPYQRLLESERKLKRSEEWLFTTLTSIGDAVIATDSRGRIDFMNPVAEKITGWSLEEAVGKDLKEIFHIVNEATGEEVESPVTQVLQKGTLFELASHTLLIAKDGAEIPIEDSAAPIRNENGMMQGVVLVFRDVTARKQAENRLKETKEQLESFIKHAADAIAMFDLEGHVLQINEAFEKIFGWTEKEVIGHKLPSIPQNRLQEMEEIYEEVKCGRQIIGLETVRQHKDGRRIDVSVTYSPVRDAKGNVVAVSGIARDISERKRREKEEKRLLAILEKTTDFVSIADSHGRVVYYNRAARNILGIGEEEDLSRITIPDTHPKWANRLIRNEGLPTAAREGVWSGETAFLSRDGREIPVHQIILAHQSEDGHVEYYSTVARDLTEMKRSQEKERLAAKVFESVTEGILVTDANGTIVSVNPAFTEITGYSEEEAVGQKPSLLRSGWHNADFYKEMWTSILEKGQWKGEIWDRRKNDEIYLEEITIRAVKDEQGMTTHYVGVFKDITLRKQMEKHIEYQAYHDALTGLPNRTFFFDRLAERIAHAQQHQQMLAVLFLDLDRFKFINDTLGHSMGDFLLQKVAERLRRCVRETDMISRFGGDEFVLLLSDLSSREDAVQVAETIFEALTQPFVLNGQEYSISTSMGISLYPADGKDGETLIRNADTAMYRAKEQRNHYQFFMPSLSLLSSERLKLGNDLRKALKREELLLQYQPKVDLTTGELIGVEALVRWRHPELGIISPLKFIPIAEETGLILPLGEWVLNTACRQIKTWQEEGLPPVRVAVNLSMAQFQQKDLAERIAGILKESGLPPHLLELELTESMVMQNPETTSQLLQELKEIGIQISLDDFGTGYSSLSYLKRLPIDAIKMDRSFVQNLPNEEDTSLVRAIINLAHSLNMKVTAEGVETEEQIRILSSCQCDEIQGYYFSPPVSAEEIKELLLKSYI